MRRSESRATHPVEQFHEYALLGMLASGFLALAGSGYLDLLTTIVTGCGLLLRFLLIGGRFRLPVSSTVVAALTLAYLGFYPLDLFYISAEFIPATVHMICFLAVLRVLTAKSPRDYFFVKLIAFSELLAATLLSSSISFFVFLLLFVSFGVATFCCSDIRRASSLPGQITAANTSDFPLRLAGLTAAMTAAIVLMTGALFPILPRTARAAFRSVVSQKYHLPGFSNEVTLGQIGEFQQRSTPLLHVRFAGPDERLRTRWRGSSLSRFDGRRWFNLPESAETIPLVPGSSPTQLRSDYARRPGPGISYQVRLGPVDTDTLFFAGPPQLLSIENTPFLYRTAGETYRTRIGSTEGREYRAVSMRPDVRPAFDPLLRPLRADVEAEHLRVPESLDGRIPALALEQGTGTRPYDRAHSIEQYLRTKFAYTTDLPQQAPRDPLAYFLFERRRGHCEYFASAMAVMLRTIHIPSRVAIGFGSGTYNPMTGWQVVRASDAHSWVEAWIPGLGWTTFDPTPPDARIAATRSWFSEAMLWADTADTFWQEWVMNYNIAQQIDLLARAERHSRPLSDWMNSESRWKLQFDGLLAWLKRVGPFVAAIVALALCVWFAGPWLRDYLHRRRQTVRFSKGGAVASDAAVLYNRMLRTLRARGVEKPGWLTPREFAAIVPRSPDGDLVQQITSEYHDLRYGGKTDAGLRMMHLLQELENGVRQASRSSSRAGASS